MEMVDSNDESAPSCTSLWFEPWRDMYDNGMINTITDDEDNNSTRSDTSARIKSSIYAEFLERTKTMSDKDFELHELESTIEYLDELMHIASESNHHIRCLDNARAYMRKVYLEMMQEKIEPTQPEDVNRNSFPESSSGQVKVEKNVRVSDKSLQNKFQSDLAELPDANIPSQDLEDLGTYRSKFLVRDESKSNTALGSRIAWDSTSGLENKPKDITSADFLPWRDTIDDS